MIETYSTGCAARDELGTDEVSSGLAASSPYIRAAALGKVVGAT